VPARQRIRVHVLDRSSLARRRASKSASCARAAGRPKQARWPVRRAQPRPPHRHVAQQRSRDDRNSASMISPPERAAPTPRED
jgi:hypothetical protein